MSPVLHSFGFWRGQRRCVSDLEPIDASAAQTLAKAGYEHFMESELDVSVMAGRAAAECLASSGIDPARVEHVIVVSESLWDRPLAASPARPSHIGLRDSMLHEVVGKLGLHDAQLHGSWMSGCGNLVPALATARALAAQGTGEVLLICADRVQPGVSRVFAGNQEVFSDIGAACLIGSRPGGLRLRHVVLHTSIEILKAQRDGNFLAVALELRSGLTRLDAKVRAATGSGIAEIGPVLTENLNPLLVRACCQTIGVPPASIQCPTLRQDGHAFSADLLLSLEYSIRENSFAPGGRLVALSISSWSLGALVLELA